MKYIPLLLLLLVYGCIFREPATHRFSYNALKLGDKPGMAKTSGFYYAIYKDEEQLIKYDKEVIKFEPEGKLCFMQFGANDTLINTILPFFNKTLASPKMLNKGYYYMAGDTLKIECLKGSEGYGYYWVYYEGIFNRENILLVKQTGYKRYRIALKSDGAGWEKGLLQPAREFRFITFK